MIPYLNTLTQYRSRSDSPQERSSVEIRSQKNLAEQREPTVREAGLTEGVSQDEVMEQDSDFVTSLDQVGSIPNLSVLKEMMGAIQAQTYQKRQDLTNLMSGISFNNVHDLLTDIVGSAINYPVDDLVDIEELTDDVNKEKNDTKVNLVPIDPTASIGSIPMEPRPSVSKNFSSLMDKYSNLTTLSFDEFNNEVVLRNKIKEILKLPNLDPAEYRFLIQKLMSHSYSEKLKKNTNISRTNNISEKSGFTNKSNRQEPILEEDEGEDEDEEDEDEEEEEERVVLTAKDKTPTYYNLEDNILGCKHYQRNCKIECKLCQKWFTCRFCHDEVIKDHSLPREKTKHILCMFCQTPQEPSQICYKCDEVLAHYYCDKCKLFDNDKDKSIYHCDDCGICRLGIGLDKDFFHCHNCNICISINLLDSHQCINNSTHSNCSICNEYMFDSTKKIIFMSPCSHPIHESCFKKHIKYSYKCPMCQKTVISMEKNFRILDLEIKEHELPEPMCNWKSVIKCNDCHGKSYVDFHFMGLKCDHCNSYNTMQMQLIKPEEGEGVPNENTTEDNGWFNNRTKEKDQKFELTKSSLVTNFDKDERENMDKYDNINMNLRFPNQEKFINDFTSKFLSMLPRMKDNYGEGKESNNKRIEEDEDEEEEEEDYLIDNFINIVNNFDAYSNITDAFKDWMSTKN